MNCLAAKKFPTRVVFAAAVLAVFFQSAAGVCAQDRWLLVFENSAAMKKRMPATGLALQQLFFTGMGGEMHSGDSLGVWTFDQTLHVGEFPLSTWQPEMAAGTASNLMAFLNKRSFKGEVNFNALQPVLSEVVAGSRRLTVLIFCEGQGEVIWTPYNDGINRTLRQNYAERKKNSQPFIIVLRVQEGKYFGCSVNFPPGGVNFPMFPPLVVAAKPEPEPTNTIAAEPEKKRAPADSTPLVIVGKNVGTNMADLPPLPPKTEINPPPAAMPVIATNNPPATNAAAAAEISPTPAVAPAVSPVTNSTTASLAVPASSLPVTAPVGGGYRFLIVTGTLALLTAVGLALFLVVRSRAPRGSLITDSLNAPHLPPSKK